jgi:hypothetical protein
LLFRTDTTTIIIMSTSPPSADTNTNQSAQDPHSAAPVHAPGTLPSEPELAPLSKNAQKKAQKAAYIQDRKLERRAREKKVRREKKRMRVERLAAGEELSEDERAAKRKKGPRTPFDARVVVDLGFDDMMTEKVRQCTFTPYLPCILGYNCTSGNILSRFSACIHIQREPPVICALRIAAVHLPEWPRSDSS